MVTSSNLLDIPPCTQKKLLFIKQAKDMQSNASIKR
jgi:hypothetical protein